jgi:predicted small lipoprotein YifL
MNFKKLLYLILICFFAIVSCGKKGPLTYPEGQKRPKFDKVIDEEN